MREKHLAALERVGLSTAEAQIYLALVRNGAPMGASAVVSATGVPRSSVYPTLSALVDKGLVEAEAGYGGRFSPVSAEQALASLMVREREELLQREEIALGLAAELKSLQEPSIQDSDAEVIQVLRDPRVIGDRFARLHLEAKRQIEVCVKAPFLLGPIANPVQEKALRRGVRGRGLYERAALDAPEVRPFLETWISKGEEVRIYNGELPHKLALFDRQSVLLPLFMPRGQVRTLYIRHPQLATSLGIMFDFLWGQAEPMVIRSRPARKKRAESPTGAQRSTNGSGERQSQRSPLSVKNRKPVKGGSTQSRHLQKRK